jgi:hypothetical protein
MEVFVVIKHAVMTSEAESTTTGSAVVRLAACLARGAAEVMGVVGVLALLVNGGVAFLTGAAIPICARSGFARAMTPSATSR